jgi:hypothetical protein
VEDGPLNTGALKPSLLEFPEKMTQLTGPFSRHSPDERLVEPKTAVVLGFRQADSNTGQPLGRVQVPAWVGERENAELGVAA